MVAPTLNNYEYQYKDTGVLLNQATSTVPFWDVEAINGIADLPELSVDILDLDGRHGSFVYSKFYKHRVIEFNGTLYASVTDADTPIETFKGLFIPDGTEYPLYWKHPNKSQRYFLAQPQTFKSDVEAGRRVGKIPFNIVWLCGDPRSFIDLSTINWTTNVNTSSFTNAGNVSGPLIVNITANTTTTASIVVQNVTQGRTVTLGFPITSGQTISIDTETWIVRVNGLVKPSTQAISTGYPTFQTGAQTWRVTSNTGNGTIVAKSAWL
jgi:hypothetical protein